MNLGWLEWTAWSYCSVTCGPGTEFRTRKCFGTCPGDSEEIRQCNDPNVPMSCKIGQHIIIIIIQYIGKSIICQLFKTRG